MQRPAQALDKYRQMRDFTRTREPRGAARARKSAAPIFVVQKHAARSLHYDFRLELDGVLKSWAVPKGPSMDRRNRRLAVHVEDHPLEYATFAGTIPAGAYGAGHVEIWDRGHWTPIGDPHAGLEVGNLKFELHGTRLSGKWGLIRMRAKAGERGDNWLLIKERDDDADADRAKPKRARPSASSARSSRTAAGGPEPHVAGVRITHADRAFPDSNGLTKLDLVNYYHAASAQMLVHVCPRPLALVRSPGGDFSQAFFQKHITVDAIGAGRDQPAADYVVARNARNLLELVQWNTIEFHTWGSRRDAPERPDRIVLDLDPDPGVDWPMFRDGCDAVRTLLDRLELRWFVKTTGGKGLHFVVPLQRRHTWTEVKATGRAMAEALVRAQPAMFLAKASKAERRGRIYVDWLRNGEGATAVAAYSARARPGLPVSMPVAWPELDHDVRGAHFNVGNATSRLQRPDPWAGYAAGAQRLSATVRRALGVG